MVETGAHLRFGTELLKRGFARMQQGGVIMDVVNADQASTAEEAGAVAVMALERVPSDIRIAGGVARMADPSPSRSWPSAESATPPRRRCSRRSAST
jgi:pyridoxal biosynthesis lyase PdxS